MVIELERNASSHISMLCAKHSKNLVFSARLKSLRQHHNLSKMRQPLREMNMRRLFSPLLCLVAIFHITGWCRAAGVPSAEGENSPLGAKDPRSQEDRVVHRKHPKAPPTPREEDIPLNSRLVNLKLEQGDWSMIIENDATDSEVRDLIRHICEQGGDLVVHATLSAMFLAEKHGYQRTNYWFERGGSSPVFDKYLENLVRSAAHRPVNVIEIGSFEGGSALWIAEHLLLHPDSMLVCIDLWSTTGGADLEHLPHIDSAGSEGRFRSNMARAPNNERVTAIKGDSLLTLSGLITAGGTSTFDFIYIDGSHTMQAVLADAVLSFRLLKVSGFLIFDDMKVETYSDVERAATAVLEALERENCVEVLYNENQLVARKTAEDRWITPASAVTMGKRADNSLLWAFAAQPTTTYTA